MSDYSVDPGATIDRLIAERDAALADVERLDNALNVTDAAAEKWLSDLTKARELFELILDDPRLVVAMSSDILVPIKSLISVKSEPFESKVSALQQRLTAADERVDVLERDKARIDWLAEQPVDTLYLDDGRIIDIAGRVDLRDAIDAAMTAPRTAEGSGDD